jgi:FAD/FMN-containing dehydrogenase
MTHEEKIQIISKQLKNRRSKKPLTMKKMAVSHMVPKPNSKKYGDDKLDVSDLNEIILIDKDKKICVAEPGVTFTDLVKETLKHDLVPYTVPELKTITIGGAVAGCSIESMSYKYGGFHDSCLEYEVITARGELLVCTPENENKLIFQMMHGTFGTLGIITRLKFRLIEAKPYVHVIYKKFNNLDDYLKATWKIFQEKNYDFMDGIIHSPTELVLSLGTFVDDAPYAHAYDWMRIYYQSTKTRPDDYLKTHDYFFRYDKGVTNVTPRSFLLRLLFGRLINSSNTLNLVNRFHKLIPAGKIPVTVDTFIPYSKMAEFINWYIKEINFFPLWYVPYKRIRNYEWINEEYIGNIKDKLFLDIAIYGLKKKTDKDYYEIIEKKLTELNALKTLISTNHYTEAEFWKIWNKNNFDEVKKKTDPDNIFRTLYEKTCR